MEASNRFLGVLRIPNRTQIAQNLVWWNLCETVRNGHVRNKNKLFLMKKPTYLEIYL